MKILVIGGTYFLGRAFVDLAKNEHEITVLNRGNVVLAKEQYGNIVQVTCDRHDGKSIAKLKDNNYDVVVDFCGYQKGDISTVLEALDYNIKQYIFISTCDVYVRGSKKNIDENSPFEERHFGGEAGDYITGKVELEKELLQCVENYAGNHIRNHIGNHVENHFENHADKEICYTSIRPSVIYGPGNYAPRETMYFNWIAKAGQIIYPEDSTGHFQMVYVGDVARIILECCLNEKTCNEAFNICGDGIVDYEIFTEALEQAVDIPFERVKMTIDSIARKGIPLPFALTLAESETYRDEKVRKLGVSYTSLEKGLKDSYLSWKKEEKMDEVKDINDSKDVNETKDINDMNNINDNKDTDDMEDIKDINDIDDIIEIIDKLYEENRADEARRILVDSLKLAEDKGNLVLQLQIYNELIGYYRVTSNREELVKTIKGAIRTADALGLAGTIPYATTVLNAANGYRSVGMLEQSIELYAVAENIYKDKLDAKDMLYAGLYNNYSLLFQEMQQYNKAKEYLLKALSIVEYNNEEFEIAVTYANLANTSVMEEDYDDARQYANKSIECFEKMDLYDPHYCAALSAIGMCEYRAKNYESAARYFGSAKEIIKNSLGENSQYQRLSENYEMCMELLGKGKNNNDAYVTSDEIDVQMSSANSNVNSNVKSNINDVDPNEKESGKEPMISGLKLSELFYNQHGRKMIEEQFPEYVSKIAVGLAGEGSDCFGYDDTLSTDHDWGPGFCMWITDETFDKIGEQLQKAYDALPDTFMGYKVKETKQGSGRRGVMRISDFYSKFTGAERYEDIDWSEVKDYSLAAAVNGKVFIDEEGVFSAYREKLQSGYPDNVQFLKIAEDVYNISQNGQYNYLRMLERGDDLTADMMMYECIRNVMKLIHHMNNSYPMHDKWLHRSCRDFETDNYIVDCIEGIHNCLKNNENNKINNLVEEMTDSIAKELYDRNFISDVDNYLDHHTEELIMKSGYATKTDRQLVDMIAEIEFEAFDKVKNEGGRASCQNDWPTFSVMRKSQYLTWNRDMLLQYLYDFNREYNLGHNLITEKYGRMMESTAPERYKELEGYFPEIPENKKMVIEQIVKIQMEMAEEFAAVHPKIAVNARSLHTYEDEMFDTSYETYLRGEISTYSDKMLQLYGAHVVRCVNEGINIARQTIENTAKLYGYASLEEFEKDS